MPDFLLITSEQAILLSNVIFVVLAIIFLLLYLKEHIANAKNQKDPTGILEENRRKGYELLHQAMQKSQALIGMGELEGIRVAAETKTALGSLEKEEKQTLVSTANQAQQAVQQSTDDFKSYLDYLSKQSDMTVAKSEQMLRERVNQIVEKFEQNLSSYLTETQAQSSQAITLEMQAARQLIQTYKTEQFNLIDENIVATLEQTLSLVLNKRLSLRDHIELVYESLEKAKLEKFIA